jgi:hypothetical protein
MKKRSLAVFLAIVAFGFAQEVLPEVRTNLIEKKSVISIDEKVLPKKSFGYLRMGVSDTNLNHKDITLHPGFGAGYRLVAGSSAIDLSASFNRRKSIADAGKEETLHYTVPKADYLYYFSGNSNTSLYAGAGLAWGGVQTKKIDGSKNNFVGLISNIALGYELNRSGTIRTFAQLDVSQPAIAAVKDGAFPKAFAEFSLGAGF